VNSPDQGAQESVAEVIGRLQSASSVAPAIYLNERLVKEMFMAQLGANDSFTRTMARCLEGQASSPIVKIGGSRSDSQQIQYDLSIR
jgi:hypothetical protein